MQLNDLLFEQQYQAQRQAGAEGLYHSYDADMAHLRTILQSDYAPKAGRVLDIGCGAGNITLWLATQGFTVAGIDSAPSAIAWAQERARAAKIPADFRVGNAVHLQDVFTEPFDIILDGACYHFILGDDRRIFLKNVNDLLRPSGLFVVESLCAVGQDCPDITHEETLVGDQVALRTVGTINHLVQEVRAAGFAVAYLDVTFYPDDHTRGDCCLLATRPPEL